MLKVFEALSSVVEIFALLSVSHPNDGQGRSERQFGEAARHYQQLSVNVFETQFIVLAHRLEASLRRCPPGNTIKLSNPKCVQGYTSESVVGTMTTVYSMCLNCRVRARAHQIALTK